MKLIDGKIFDMVEPKIVIDYLKNLDTKIIEIDPRNIKVIKVDNNNFKLEVVLEKKSFIQLENHFYLNY